MPSIRPSPKSARWSTARCSISSARSIPTSRGRPTARSGFPQYAGEVGASDADAAAKAKAQKAAEAAVGETLAASINSSRGQDLHRRRPRLIADIRLACSLEFLNAIDYPFDEWTKAYASAVETALGDAYAEPAGDVEGTSST